MFWGFRECFLERSGTYARVSQFWFIRIQTQYIDVSPSSDCTFESGVFGELFVRIAFGIWIENCFSQTCDVPGQDHERGGQAKDDIEIYDATHVADWARQARTNYSKVSISKTIRCRGGQMLSSLFLGKARPFDLPQVPANCLGWVRLLP